MNAYGPSSTIALGYPVLNARAKVIAASNVTASTAVTVTSAVTDSFYGVGCAGVNTITLGTPLSFIEVLGDGLSWVIVGGGQDTGWVPLTLGTNTVALSGAYAPAARLIGSTVFLRGALSAGASVTPSGTPFATVPAACIPAEDVYLTVTALVNGIVTPGLLYVLSSTGHMTATPGWASSQLDALPFDGFTYPVA